MASIFYCFVYVFTHDKQICDNNVWEIIKPYLFCKLEPENSLRTSISQITYSTTNSQETSRAPSLN